MALTAPPATRLATLLAEVRAAGSFAARRTAAGEGLEVEVKGVGRLRLPITRAQAQRLCRVARPARYGQGERTLLDPAVRDTWEVPKSRVKIDRRRWQRTLGPVLEALGADLGLPAGSSLAADLHSLLVYAPGQHFRRHQDSEKADDMIGTLVVTLPGAFTGGELVVEHQGGKLVSRATGSRLSFVAFYADCPHEVRPVKQGHRVALTYDLRLTGGDAAETAAAPAPATVAALADELGRYFATPAPRGRYAPRDAPPPSPPGRLVVLLDHQYTERGLAWQRLKGHDAVRVAALRSAAEAAGCEVMLALADIHETWSCFEDDWGDPWHTRRRWDDDEDEDEDDDWEDEPLDVDLPERYDLEELIEDEIRLTRWLDPSGAAAEPIATDVRREEVCATTPTVELEPYESEYEGYMGNYGNTMDRWYRRAALVVWPRERAFAVRAEASPAWAAAALAERIEAGAMGEAREKAALLLPFWGDAAPQEERRGFLEDLLGVAHGLDAPDLAASLLAPFRVEALTAERAPAFVALVARYGEGWARSLLSAWSAHHTDWGGSDDPDTHAWIAALPSVAEALRAADPRTGTLAGRLLLADRWEWIAGEIDEIIREIESPTERARELEELTAPILGWLRAAAGLAAADLAAPAVDSLVAADDDAMLPVLVGVLRAAAADDGPARSRAPARRGAAARRAAAAKDGGPAREVPGLDALARHAERRLAARLAAPPRRRDDWSLAPPPGCRCEHCTRLADFLADPTASRLEWPLAKPGRRHVHERIRRHELPVSDETRRTGRPFTLVLEKKPSIFSREAAARRRWKEDREWLAARWRA